MRIEEASQFLQTNAVAQRVRQLIMGAAPRVKTTSRRPTAIALAELKEGKLEVFDPSEADALLADGAEELEGQERAAAEAARVSFQEMFVERDGGEEAEASAAEEPEEVAAAGAEVEAAAEPEEAEAAGAEVEAAAVPEAADAGTEEPEVAAAPTAEPDPTAE